MIINELRIISKNEGTKTHSIIPTGNIDQVWVKKVLRMTCVSDEDRAVVIVELPVSEVI